MTDPLLQHYLDYCKFQASDRLVSHKPLVALLALALTLLALKVETFLLPYYLSRNSSYHK